MHFVKYEAAGNDFIVVDRPFTSISLICDRKKGVGADGLIWIDGDEVHFFNQDGSKAYCCGNGLRVAFIHTQRKKLKTALGEHQVSFFSGGCRVTYDDPRAFHEVVLVEDVDKYSHPPREKNINYVKIVDRNQVLIKTIERGVGETNSCGSGAISSFLQLKELQAVEDQVRFGFPSKEVLTVSMIDQQVWLEGPVNRVFTGIFG